jgi:tetratricopeptide (TPR) repeat protein
MEFEQALALHRRGRIDEASRAYESILSTEPLRLEALIYLGALRLGQSRLTEAEALLRQAVTIAPESPEALANLAATLQALGRHNEAADNFQAALQHRPDMVDARFGLAACQQASGRDNDAVASYAAILGANPNHPEANYGAAILLARLRRTDEAEAKFRAALAADPDFAEAHLGLGKLLAGGDLAQEAVGHFLRALDVDPEYVEARVALGTALLRLYRDDEAMAEFRTVVAVEPDHPEAHNGIGTLLDRKRRHAEAIEHYRIVLANHPDNIDATAGIATSLKNIGQHAEALELARQVLASRPDSPPAIALLGSILAEIGAIDQAQIQFRRAVALAPSRPDYAYYLTELAKVRPGDDVFHVLEAMLPHIASYPAQEQCLLHFALAKVYDDIGERDRGFEHLLRGNAIKRSGTDYNEAATLAALRRIARVFTADLLAARSGQGDPSTVPIFIVGMPRSGTTLVEQILASHEAVFGAGERSELLRAVGRIGAQQIGATSFPEAVWTMTGAALRQMGAEYVAALRSLAPDAACIVDKMPANFTCVGLIRLILPNAKIIHVSRGPVDTCLSCFSKLFSGEQPFNYDLAELGRYYRGYQGLMAHWRAVLPQGVMLEVEYEALVGDFEHQARRIIAHCDLPWDPACLDFHKTSRPVHTASLVQVRQPIYRTSVGRWRPASTLLRPLLEALEGP